MVCSMKEDSSTMDLASVTVRTRSSTLKLRWVFAMWAGPRSLNSTKPKQAPFVSVSTFSLSSSPNFSTNLSSCSSVVPGARPAMWIVRMRWSSEASVIRLLTSAMSRTSSVEPAAPPEPPEEAAALLLPSEMMGSTTPTSQGTPKMSTPLSLLPSVTPVELTKSICAKNWLFEFGKARNEIFSITSWSKTSRRTCSLTSGLRFRTKSECAALYVSLFAGLKPSSSLISAALPAPHAGAPAHTRKRAHGGAPALAPGGRGSGPRS
mmetsp:Transcript_30010/g.85914  ORF Transcript_30010/g.85914 Transcript_30010/m.85914 type:complete len:264 (-) Transcript_30010:14-805(-)